MDDDMFQVPPELMAENAGKRNNAKPLNNADVTTVIQTLIERLNDIYNVVLAMEGFEIETEKTLLSPDNLNSVTVIRYINLINTLTAAIQEKVKNIEKYLSLNGDQKD